MIGTSDILIIAAISTMTVILTIIGVQLILVLRDLRRLLEKANNIVGELEKVGMSFSHGYGEVVGFLSGAKNIFSVIDLINRKKRKHERK